MNAAKPSAIGAAEPKKTLQPLYGVIFHTTPVTTV
jgi:hypothetical protein